MSEAESDVSAWLEALKAGEPASAQKLWDCYFRKLVFLAAERLPRRARRAADQEDVALSAFNSFCAGVERGRFPQLNDREDLWRLLVVITARKARAVVRRETRPKRGGGKVRGESAFADAGDSNAYGLEQAAETEPTPDFAVQVAEECQVLLDDLGDEGLRQIALLKMEGYTRQEIAEKTGRSVRSIARRLELIRDIWSERTVS
jgi:DNA-directed RNA polymerase specialized sigma24 family protein